MQGVLEEVKLKTAMLTMKTYDYEIEKNLKDLTIFDFHHKHGSQRPNNLSRLVDGGECTKKSSSLSQYKVSSFIYSNLNILRIS